MQAGKGMTTYINLPAYGIKVTLVGDGLNGSIESDLERLTCPCCGLADCCYNCDGSQAGGEAYGKDDVEARLSYNGCLDAIESLVLAQACSGLDISTPAYLEALETALDTVTNKYT